MLATVLDDEVRLRRVPSNCLQTHPQCPSASVMFERSWRFQFPAVWEHGGLQNRALRHGAVKSPAHFVRLPPFSKGAKGPNSKPGATPGEISGRNYQLPHQAK